MTQFEWRTKIDSMNDVTQILKAVADGDPNAANELLPLVYAELRELAAQRMSHESPGLTLQPTALVHEAFLRLVSTSDTVAEEARVWDNRGHFFAAAAEAMRRILVDNARRRKAEKRGGSRQRIPLEEFHRISESPQDMLDLDEVLTLFAAEEPDKAKLVQLRFFAGLTIPDAAASLGISHATAERWWTYSRAWLYNSLRERFDEKSDS